MIKNSPDYDCITVDFVVYVLVKAVGKCAVVAKVNFSGSGIVHEVVNFTKYVITEPGA